MRRIILIIMAFLLIQGKALAIEWPQDFPTIEALISLHKMIKGEEDAARDKIAVSFGEQSLVTKGANKFNDARTTLDSKLSNGYSYVLLAASLSYTASSMYKLIQEYSEFAQLSVQYSTKKPMVAWYFAEANLACSREIKNIKALYLTMTASGLERDEGFHGRETESCELHQDKYRHHARHHRQCLLLGKYRGCRRLSL